MEITARQRSSLSLGLPVGEQSDHFDTVAVIGQNDHSAPLGPRFWRVIFREKLPETHS